MPPSLVSESPPKKDDPFLLYVAFNAPHHPLQAPKKAVEKYKGRYDEGWDVLRKQRQLNSKLFSNNQQLSPRPDHVPAWDSLSKEDQHQQTRRMEIFAAMVDILDRNVGRLVEHLKKKNFYENTLIFFCSDNGACPFDRTKGGNKEPWDPKSYRCYDTGWAHMGNTPFRLYKQNQYQGGISAPLIAKENPERVEKMSEEWFRIAKDIERFPKGQLKPVKTKLTPLFSAGKSRK